MFFAERRKLEMQQQHIRCDGKKPETFVFSAQTHQTQENGERKLTKKESREFQLHICQ